MSYYDNINTDGRLQLYATQRIINGDKVLGRQMVELQPYNYKKK